jgi:D-alanyl-D-alanine carboxypeptidase
VAARRWIRVSGWAGTVALAASAALTVTVPAAARDARPGGYPGAIGIKTGYTPDAGHCLLFEVTRRGLALIGVNLDSPGVGTTVNGAAATRMLNWAFSRRGY